jgi:hypothetical protein
VTHAVEVTGATLFEAAVQALAVFESEGWAAGALATTAVFEIEVVLPPVSHRVPLTPLRKWIAGPTTSAREQTIKQSLKDGRKCGA